MNRVAGRRSGGGEGGCTMHRLGLVLLLPKVGATQGGHEDAALGVALPGDGCACLNPAGM